MVANFLSQVLVRDVMQSNVPVIHRETSIKEASKSIIDSDFTHIPVVEDGNKLAGILTAWDVANAVANDFTSLGPIMTTDVITALPEEPVKKITAKINQYNISALPVVDENDEVLGIVTSDSITQLVRGQQPIPGTEEIKENKS
jgi:homoserine O-acetyltransferase